MRGGAQEARGREEHRLSRSGESHAAIGEGVRCLCHEKAELTFVREEGGHFPSEFPVSGFSWRFIAIVN